MNFKEGLNPIIGDNAKILILGSLPGDESIRKQEYYGNPNNMFWNVIGNIIGEKAPEEYCQKIEYLKRHGIALWDVLNSATREGSLDSNIKNEKFNNIAKLVSENPSINVIVTNGGKAEKLFKKYVQYNQSLTNKKFYFCKSTSAMSRCAGWNLERLICHWREIL